MPKLKRLWLNVFLAFQVVNFCRAQGANQDGCSDTDATLQTVYGAYRAHGNMFDVVSTSSSGLPTMITGMEVSMRPQNFLERSDFTVQVWTKEGSHVGFENDMAAWSQVFSQDYDTSDLPCSICTNVELDDLVSLEFQVPVPIENTAAFYVTVANLDSFNVITGDEIGTEQPGTAVVQDEYLLVKEGSALESYFGNVAEPSRGVFSGKIHYSVCAANERDDQNSSDTGLCSENPVTLQTADTGEMRAHGVMWDIQALTKNITVTELRIPIDAQAPTFDFDILQLWTKEGSLVGFESNPSVWSPVLAKSVDYPSFTNGFRNFWSLPVEPLDILAGETRAFYVTTFGDERERANFMVSQGGLDEAIDIDLGTLNAFDAHVEIKQTIALASYFGRGTDGAMLTAFWNGILLYNVCDPEEEITQEYLSESSCSDTFNTQQQVVSLGLEEEMRIIKFDVEYAINATVDSLLLLLRDHVIEGDFMVSVWSTEGSLGQADENVSTWDIVFRSSIRVDFAVWLPEDRFRTVKVTAGQPRSFAVGFLLLEDRSIPRFPLRAGGGIRPAELAVMTPDLVVRESGSVFSGALRYSSCEPKRRYVAQCMDETIMDATTVPSVVNPGALLVVSGPHGGVMFDIRASETIEVGALDTRLTDIDNLGTASGIVSVWTKSGSYVGFEDDESAWMLLFRHEVRFFRSSREPLPRGLTTRIPREVFQPKVIPAGSTQAFYVTMHADTDLANIAALPLRGPAGSLISDDGIVQIYSGVTLSEQFGEVTSSGNGYFGYINYRRCSDMSPQDALTASGGPVLTEVSLPVVSGEALETDLDDMRSDFGENQTGNADGEVLTTGDPPPSPQESSSAREADRFLLGSIALSIVFGISVSLVYSE